MRRRILIGLVFVFSALFNSNSYGQSFSMSNQPSAQKVKVVSSLYDPNFSYAKDIEDDSLFVKKRFWRASGELMIAQIIPWAFNRYVRDAEFADITWESIKHNLKLSSWTWDDNNFMTNQFAHPYHGHLYYSAFRTNGYSFWQSVPAALTGSYIWEVFGETHPPAPNDLINTTLGGIALGEMSYRFSNLIVDNQQTGFKRQANEVMAFLVNPMNGLNRIIDGKWGRVMANPADRKPDFLNGVVDVGYRRISTKIDDILTKGDNEFFARAFIQYGNPYRDFGKPFSNFSLAVELGASDSAMLNNVQVNGMLYGTSLKETDRVHHVLTATMNYDYIRNTSIQYGSQSFSLKLLSDHIYKNKSNLFTEIGIIGVVLASIPDDYLFYGEGRNYDYGPGAGFLAGVKLDIQDRFLLSVNYKGIWFNTVNGNESDFYLHTFIIDARYYINSRISLAIQPGYFVQNSDYYEFDDVIRRYPYAKVSVGYTIGSR
ncbi:MAG: DUF3943 domain-containing protein [Bacteroidia bacterium]|nr:DUF3943 domain-containing protein [Bacteroidia bacterium]